jgi:PAS domain S-box-containing protein/putative nucleotidyltransferase with HDIG domain
MKDRFLTSAEASVKDAQRASELKALRVSESRYRRLFETAQDGILLLNAETAQIEDVNPYLIHMLGYSHTEFLGKKLWEVGPFADIKESKEMFLELQTKGYVRYEDLPLRTATGVNIEVEFVSNTYDCEGIRIIQCNIRNITDRRITEKKFERHTQLYAALSQCNKAIVHCTSEEKLFSQVCQAAVQFGGMEMAWIGLVDPETRRVQPAASFGEGIDYLSSLKLSIDANSPYGGEPTCIAIRENRPYWCQDLLSDPATIPWRELIQRAGWAASASLPLRRNGVVIGAFILYSSVVRAFDELAENLMTEMATDISFALGSFDRESQRKSAEQNLREAEEQFRGLVEQSIVGIYIIQDGKFTYINPRCAEIIGHGSVDELKNSDPLSWVIETDQAMVAENLRRLQVGEVQSVAMDFGIQRRDGVDTRIGVNITRATQRGKLAFVGVAQDISEKKRAEEEVLRYIEQLRTTLNGTIEVVEIISEMRDPYTAGHEQRVAQIAVALAAELGLDAHQQEGLRVAGNLHDVGKIMIPAEILSKPSKLSPIEYALVQGHVQAGYDILKNVKFPWPVAQMVLQHHERMDGSGYPQGLKGEAILLEARILAVADVVEAMSSHRPYRPGLNIEAALDEIERNKGVKYDTNVVDACLKLFREQGYTLPA